MTHTLPPGWEEKTLGEVCEIISGTTPDTKCPQYWGGTNFWITPAELTEGKIFIDSCRRKITDLAVRDCSLRPMPKGTVVFSSRAPIGKVAINNLEVLYCNQGFKNFICSQSLDNKFLFYFLKFNTPLLVSLGHGTTFKEISKTTISKVTIRFPTLLEEQKRIVEKLDKIFSAIDKAKSQTEKNLQNAKDVFSSCLNNIFNHPAHNWEEKKLEDIVSVLNGLWTGKKPPYCQAFVIRNTNFTKDCRLDLSDVANLQVEQRQFDNRELKKGDILVEKSGGGPKQPVGRVVLFDKTERGFSFSNFTSVLRIKNPTIISYYFLYWVLYFCYLSGKTIPMQKYTTGIRNLQMSEYKELKVSFPSLVEQKRIVEKLDILQSKTKELEKIYTQKLADLEGLKQSVLQQAFSGKL
ncbi:MAG: restriction endonuclease subunit S [Elusimicrobiaceae bacterium]